MSTHERTIGESKQRVIATQGEISKMDKTIGESKEILRNFKDNQQVRKLAREVETLEDEFNRLDVESAEKAHRTYQTEFAAKRNLQTSLSARVRLPFLFGCGRSTS